MAGRLLIRGRRPAEFTARELLQVVLAFITDNELTLDKEQQEVRDKSLRAIAAIPEQYEAERQAEQRQQYTEIVYPGLQEAPEG